MKTRFLAAVAGYALFALPIFAVTYVVPRDEVLINTADAIVIARPLHSDVRESRERGIETITVFAVEEVVKGDSTLDGGLTVRVPGGTIESNGKPVRAKLIPGAPRFTDGDRLLLLVTKLSNGEYAVTDLGLGLFGFATDNAGHRVLIRAESEISGWEPDGKVHAEARRDADRFLAFIRDLAKGRPADPNYTVEVNPLVGESPSLRATMTQTRSTILTCSGCTVTQYTLPSTNETSAGFRWNTAPVNWNRGNTESNATSNGDAAINNAFSVWNTPSSAAYVYSTTTSNTNGIMEVADGVNNIVFEKDMSTGGIPNYVCSGGVLGLGGISAAISDASNMVNGETFFKNTEGDVSMNKGVNACIPGSIPQGDFTSAVTHELGHSLGLRHADRSRDSSQACTNFPAYDCATSAIMTATVTSGLNGALTAWDQRAITALYPPTAFAAPASVTATATSSTAVTISWSAVSGVVSGVTVYHVQRSSDATNFADICTATAPTVTCNDTTASANTAYLYKVRAGASGTFSAKDLATTVIFTDDPLSSSIAVKTTHITQLRTAVDAVRKLANNGVANNYSYTDSTLTGGTTFIKGVHLTDLRTALDTARSSLSLSALSYTDTTINSSVKVKAQHFTELRNGVK